MIDTLGFTTEEGQILEGYCDKAAGSKDPYAPSVNARWTLTESQLLNKPKIGPDRIRRCQPRVGCRHA
ncbi:hypothetical protein NC651_022161 [Populus alba x Populus x berolinensis]|nr:hypothetical protein NC651_022161 [Populus alba x Populus x berolinensis]